MRKEGYIWWALKIMPYFHCSACSMLPWQPTPTICARLDLLTLFSFSLFFFSLLFHSPVFIYHSFWISWNLRPPVRRVRVVNCRWRQKDMRADCCSASPAGQPIGVRQSASLWPDCLPSNSRTSTQAWLLQSKPHLAAFRSGVHYHTGQVADGEY